MWLTSAVLILLICSCIKEYPQTDEWQTKGLRLSFAYPGELADGKVNIVEIFAFDTLGVLAGQWKEQVADFNKDYYLDLPLDTGTYRIISWMNTTDNLVMIPTGLVVGQTRLEDMYLNLQADATGLSPGLNSPLFYGQLERIRLLTGVRPELSLPIQRDSYSISVQTWGLDVDTADQFELVISDTKASLDFQNILTGSTPILYTAACRIAPVDNMQELSASLEVLFLSEDRPEPVISLKNKTSTEVIFESNLVELLLKLREQGVAVDFSSMYSFELLLKFNAATATVSILVNGWPVIEDSRPIHG